MIDLALLAPDMQERLARLDELLAADGLRIRLVSGRRSCSEQNRLYAQGRTAPGAIVTDARGCRSWHVLGRAVDFDFGSPWSTGHRPTAEDYAHVGGLWRSLGGVWGVTVSGGTDLPHLEYHPGMTIGGLCPNPDACRDGQTPAAPPGQAVPPPPSRTPWGEIFALGAAAALGVAIWKAGRG